MLRGDPTPTEAALWKQLRGRQLNGYKFRRQHPVGRFVLDFYCDEVQLAVEIDGAVHLDSDQALADREREEILQERGIRFLRFTATQVAEDMGRVLEGITLACTGTTPPLHASGEGAGG
jgi:very-short-patch-repair endonuclease